MSTCKGVLTCEVCGDCGCKTDICDCCAVKWAQSARAAAPQEKVKPACVNCGEGVSYCHGRCRNCDSFWRRHDGLERTVKRSVFSPPVAPTPTPPRPRKSAQKILAPASLAHAGWKIDVRAIHDAMELLGVTRKVKFILSQGRRRIGSCGFDRLSDTHLIRISTFGDLETASCTLWHELQHAAQRDAEGVMEFNDNYKWENRRMGYRRNKYEVEARKTGDFGRTIPLVKRVTMSGPRTFTSTQARALTAAEW